jgi:hypothetical protein
MLEGLKQATISVVVRPWSGWTREQPPPSHLRFVAKPGQVITSQLLGYPTENYAVSVGGINALGIELAYQGLVMENGDGTVNLSGPRTGSLVLTIRQSIHLSTATMDAGTSFDVTLEGIE